MAESTARLCLVWFLHTPLPSLPTVPGVVPLVVGSGVKTGEGPRQPSRGRGGSDCEQRAALSKWKPPLVVVDLEPRRLSIVDADGNYVGGAIAPGLRIAAEALFNRLETPYGRVLKPQNAIGKNTIDCSIGSVSISRLGGLQMPASKAPGQ